ncbi:MAG: hypothetical protein GKC10_07445 [Methanosarcinales archaeon]|nr:hypothetical protein [Methanosarcinales archaeon]
MKQRLELIKRYLKVTRAYEIARRLFVMNAFDGVLTIMGVVMGAHLSGVANPNIVITAGIGGSVAMGISGMSGAYMAERAERMRDLKKLELAMLTHLDETHVARASRVATIIIALVDGISPALCASVLILPYLLVPAISMDMAFYTSIVSGLGVLFLLGTFLAKISEENLIRAGMQMVAVGLVTIVVVSFLIGSG